MGDNIKTLKFILGKIVIVEVMLLILYFATVVFGIHLSYVDIVIEFALTYLTPIAVISLIPYIVLSILDNQIFSTIFGIVVFLLISYYVFKILGVI